MLTRSRQPNYEKHLDVKYNRSVEITVQLEIFIVDVVQKKRRVVKANREVSEPAPVLFVFFHCAAGFTSQIKPQPRELHRKGFLSEPVAQLGSVAAYQELRVPQQGVVAGKEPRLLMR